MKDMERMIDEATNSMFPESKHSANALQSRLSQVAGGQYDSMGDIWLLRGEIRSEFRGIYESIIDSTIAAMY